MDDAKPNDTPGSEQKSVQDSANTAPDETVIERIRGRFNNLTRAERQLANLLLSNYPIAGLVSITKIARAADVSTPTVVRMSKKLGFKGFPHLQSALRDELEATISNPITRHDRWSQDAPDTHILNRFADSVMDNMRQTLRHVDLDSFTAAANMLTDPNRKIFVVGGRITHSLADHFFTHMQVIRDRVTLIASNANSWPHYVLNMHPGDVLVLFDIRRYEHDILTLARMAQERGVELILLTDHWGSPAAKFSSHTIQCRTEAPSAWDSSVVILFIIEALISAAQDADWEGTKDRVNELEHLFDQTKLFRKFI